MEISENKAHDIYICIKIEIGLVSSESNCALALLLFPFAKYPQKENLTYPLYFL